METRRQHEQLMQQIWEEHQRQVEEETWSLHPLEDIDERYVVKSGKNDGNWLMEKFLDDCDQVRIDRDLRNKSIEQTRLKLLEMELQVLREEIEEKRENRWLMRLFDEEQEERGKACVFNWKEIGTRENSPGQKPRFWAEPRFVVCAMFFDGFTLFRGC